MNFLRSAFKDKRGSVTVMFAGGLSMLVAVSALAIDTASFYNDKRRLQAAADAAALAAAADPQNGRTAAIAAIRANNGTEQEVDRFTLGVYSPDPNATRATRFQTGMHSSLANAAQVHMQRQASTIFARAIGAGRFVTVEATATAARIDLASFSLGSRIASISGGLPNAILSGLTGTQLNLTLADYNSLVSANVDLLGALEALKTNLDLDVATFEDVLDARVTLPQITRALAAATSNTAAAALLRSLATKLPEAGVPLSAMIDLGPLGADIHADQHRPITLDAFSMLRAMIEASSSRRQVSANVGLDVPGLTQTKLILQIGERAASSPWLAVSKVGEVTVRTAQARLLLDMKLTTPVLNLGQIQLPLYVELGSASAKLASVSCRGGRNAATASLDVTPSTGQLALGTVDTANIGNFARDLTVHAAPIATLPLVSVTGRAVARLSATQAQRVQFNASQIQNGIPQTVSAGVSSEALLSSLIQNTEIDVNILGLGLGLTNGLIGNAVLSALGLVLSPVDQVLNGVLALAGVRIGQADAWMNGVRCGTPMLVA